MQGAMRRKKILEMIQASDKPLSGSAIGQATGVSRQIVVQDIALLRTEGWQILATARGYILEKPHYMRTLVKVCHSAEQTDSVVVWNTATPQYARVLVPIENVGWCWAYVCHPKLQVYIYSSQGYSLNSMGGIKAWQGNTAAAMFLIHSKTACDFYVLQPDNTPV